MIKITSSIANYFPLNQIPLTGYSNQVLNFFNTDISPGRLVTDYDNEISYEFNENGYRCGNFIDENLKVLILGCSVTFGNGIPVNRRYSSVFCNKLSEKFNLKVFDCNMGWPGESCDFVSRMALICVPLLKPDVLITNFPSFSRREYFDINCNRFDHRPDRNQNFLNQTQKFIGKNLINLSSDYQDIYNFFKNYKLLEQLVSLNGIKWLYSIQRKDIPVFSLLSNHFNLKIKVDSMEKIDFARDGGHPGVKTNEIHGLNYFKKYLEIYD